MTAKILLWMVQSLNKRVKRLSPAQKAWITRKIRSGKSKYETALELGIPYHTVCKTAKHLRSHRYGRSGIRGQTLEMLQELVTDGYAFCTPGSDTQKYHTLKKYFPTIQKVSTHGKSILFLEDKADIATRTFLKEINRKIISYQELKQITKIFDVKLSRKEKNDFLGRFQSKKLRKFQGSKNDSLLKNDDSLAFFYIRKYCGCTVCFCT